MKTLILGIGLLISTTCAYGNSATLYFLGFQPGWWQMGYPYYATVNGGSVVDVMCDDWLHGGLPGDVWQANFTNLGTGDLSLLRYNRMPGALTRYDEAGWLILQTLIAPQTEWTDINYAVWHIFDPNAPLPGTAPLYWLNLAQQEANRGFPGVNFYEVGIYTPVNQYDRNMNDPQELLTIVPEPNTLAMFGAGLVGLAGILRRKVNLAMVCVPSMQPGKPDRSG